MRRRDFIAGLASMGGWTSTLYAQSSSRRYRVGMLDTSARHLNPNLRHLEQALRERGYIEGQNLTFEYRSPDGRNESFAELAKELVHLDVDVIVTRGTPAALAAKAASATVPVVMAAAGDPQAIIRGGVAPSSNLTGFGAFAPGVERKRVEILKAMLAKVERVAALMNLSNPSRRSEWNEIDAGARSVGRADGELELIVTKGRGGRNGDRRGEQKDCHKVRHPYSSQWTGRSGRNGFVLRNGRKRKLLGIFTLPQL